MRKALKPILKILIITVLVVPAIIIGNNRLENLGNETAAEIITDLIRTESKGLYELDFEHLEVNILLRTVRVFKAQLTPNYAQISDSSTISNVYQVSVDYLDIDLQSVWKLYTTNELLIKGVNVVNPLISMTKVNPEKKAIKFGRETGELYEIISDYLDLLHIEYFHVTGGGINHYPSKLSLNTINFGITDFTLDSVKNKRKVFYSEDINLGLNNQVIDLPDSIHVLSFDGFKLSTKDSILSFTNLKIAAKTSINVEKSFQEDQQNIYNIAIPVLELKGINYLKVYEDNHLVIDEVNIPKPIINIMSVSAAASDEKEEIVSENTIGNSLLALFDLIMVKRFKINEADLELVVRINNQQQFKSNNVSIELFDILLDSSNYRINSRTSYFENAKISINEYDYKLPDSLHTIAFKSLAINTFNSSLIVEDFTLKPERKLNNTSISQYDFNIPNISLTGINYQEALIDKRMSLTSMVFTNPIINIEPYGRESGDKIDTVFTPKVLQSLLNTYFEEIKATDIQVNNGDVKVGSQFSIKAINLKLENLAIDTAVKSWHDVADSIYLQAKDLNIHLKQGDLLVGNINAGKKLHNFNLTDFSYKDQFKNDFVQSKQLIVNGVQLDSMIQKSIIQINFLSLINPTIELQQRKTNGNQQQSDWTWPKNPITMKIIDGNFNFKYDSSSSLQIGQFSSELIYKKGIKVISFISNNLQLKDEGLGHKIKIEDLKLPKYNSNVLIKNLRFEPFNDKINFHLNTNIPSLQIINFNREIDFSVNKLKADSLILQVDDMIFEQSHPADEEKDKDSEDIFGISFKAIVVQIKQTKVEINEQDGKNLTTSIHNAKILLKDFNYPKSTSNNSIFYARNVAWESSEIHVKTQDEANFSTGFIHYNSSTKDGNLNNLSYKHTKSNTDVIIKKIEVENWDVKKYIYENIMDIGNLTVAEVGANFTMALSEDKELNNLRYLPFKRLIINNLNTEKIDFNIEVKEKDRFYRTKGANLKLQKLTLDSTFNINELHHSLSAFSLSGKNYKEDIGKFYTISCADYFFSYPGSFFTANDILLESKFNRFEFSRQIQFQTDWFNLKIASLHLKGINLNKLFQEELIVRKAEIDEADFTVFRDLQVPLDSSKFVALPQESLRKLKIPVFIDTVKVRANINIFVAADDGSGIGVVSINDLDGGIYGLKSRDDGKNKPIELSTKGKLNKLGDFQANVSFDYPSPKSSFRMNGNIGAMEMTSLNEMMIPIAAVEVRSGMSESVVFNFEGNDDFARGNMDFKYNNLKVNILDGDTYQSSGLSNSLVTFFANSFVVRGQNPNFFKFNQGTIFYERDKSRSIFNYWAKALLSGVVSSIGINSSKEDEKEYYNKENIEE
jgi:hypothetical protein